MITPKTDIDTTASTAPTPIQRSVVNRTENDAFYRELLVSNYPLVERVIASVTQRYRLRADEAEELGSRVRLKLVEHGYGVLRKFEGRSSLATYLSTVVSRVCLDTRVVDWGKWRPSATARRQGETAIRLERLIERDRLRFEEAYEVLRTNFRVRETRQQLEDIAAALPRRVRRRMVSDGVLNEMPAPSPDETDKRAVDAQSCLANALAALLPPDRHLLELRFEYQWTVPRIARLLEWDVKSTYRRLERVLRHLRSIDSFQRSKNALDLDRAVDDRN